MDIAMGYPMTSNDALWWQTFWTAAAAIATFIAAFVALFVGLASGWRADEKEKLERRQVTDLIFQICLPAWVALQLTSVPDEHGAIERKKVNEAFIQIAQAERQIKRFDFVWRALSSQQASRLLTIENIFAELTSRLSLFLANSVDGEALRLVMEWETQIVDRGRRIEILLNAIRETE